MAGLEPVVHPDLGRRRGIGVGAFLLALATAGAMAHVGVRMKGIEVAYDLGREKRVNTQLEEERRRLNIEIGMLKDPVRVVSIARDKLNMGPPAQTDIVRLGPGQILGAPPAPSDAPAKRERPVSAMRAPKAPASVARAKADGTAASLPSLPSLPSPPSQSSAAAAEKPAEDGAPGQGAAAREGDE